MTQMTLEQIRAEQERLRKMEEELIAKTRDEDFETVKALIKKHGFTKTQLRGVLPVLRKSKPKKS